MSIMFYLKVALFVVFFVLGVFLFKWFAWRRSQKKENACEYCYVEYGEHDIDCPSIIEANGTSHEAYLAKMDFKQGYLDGLTNSRHCSKNGKYLLGYRRGYERSHHYSQDEQYT